LGCKISQGEGVILQIRNSAKAIIFKDSKVLLTKHHYMDGFFYIFPGGGQEHGETLREAVVRECLEEVDEKVVVKQLLHIREYIGKNHEYAEIHGQVHQIEFYFICELVNDTKEQKNPSNPDSHQVGIEWIDVENLKDYRVYPKSIRKYIIDYSNGISRSVYLGDNN
jgi:8-oxo-dGTP diphosphatase